MIADVRDKSILRMMYLQTYITDSATQSQRITMPAVKTSSRFLLIFVTTLFSDKSFCIDSKIFSPSSRFLLGYYSSPSFKISYVLH
jgi:hypothetical protein